MHAKSFQCGSNETSVSIRFDQCIPSQDNIDNDDLDWCYTRTHLNNSAIRGQWGYCDPNCKGEGLNHENSSMFNLASKEHNDLWSEDIFILASGSSGHCHTYNPKNLSLAKARGGFYSMLGIKYNLSYVTKCPFHRRNKIKIQNAV